MNKWSWANGSFFAWLLSRFARVHRVLRRLFVATGFAAAALWLGIALVLETQKGRIIIETDSPNLNVSLIETDENTSQQIKLIPSENSTRIFAGRYEIRIDDGTDNFTLERNAFVLKRGETIVAKVRLDEPAGTADIVWSENSHAWSQPGETEQAGLIALSSPLPLSEPVYAGHPLGYWLNKLEFDVDEETRFKAIKTIQQLTKEDSNSRDKVRAMLASRPLPLPSLAWFSDLTWTVGLSQDHIDDLLTKLKSSTNEETVQVINLLLRDSFYRSVDEFEKADVAISQALKVLANREQVPAQELIDNMVSDVQLGFRAVIPWM